MEAAATPLHRPRVRTQGEHLVVDALVVGDACAVRLAREREQAGADPAPLVRDAIEIGARVLDREQAAVQTDFVRAEFERASREVEAAFAQRASETAQAMARKVDEAFSPDTGLLSRALARHFSDGSADAVQHRVRALVDEVMRGAREDLRHTFAADDARNPLADFKRASLHALSDHSRRQDDHLRALHEKLAGLERELQGLRDEQRGRAEVAAERERGTAKGRDYEAAVAEALDEIALAQGDACDRVGDLSGALGRKGDVVVELDACAGPARGRLVFEAKDRRLSRPEATKELDQALRERHADFAVLVVPTEDELPARIVPLREYNGDKLVVAWGPQDGSRLTLEVAYKLARARVLMARAGQGALDPSALRDRIARARAAMDEIRRVKLALTGAAKNVGDAQGLLDALAGAVRAELDEIEALLVGVTPS